MIQALLFLAAGVQTQTPPEVTTKDEAIMFQSKVTLIQVPVVVRDKNGKAIGTLRKENFQLFDKGKAQTITQFSIETSAGKAIARTASLSGAAGAPGDKAAETIIAPDHFIGLLFDDVHMSIGDVVPTRAAAQKFIASGMKPTDRVAIFTTSGQTTLEFTDDRDSLNQTLLKLLPHPLDEKLQDCIHISAYQADQIVNMHDPQALAAAVAQAAGCYRISVAAATEVAESRAKDVFLAAEHETHVALSSLGNVTRRMAILPGTRTLILASPGFIRAQSQHGETGPAVDLAIRSGVIINTLDSRGLYGLTVFHADQRSTPTVARQRMEREAAEAQGDVLADIAAGTGGKLIAGNNDFTRGFQQLAEAPEVYYLLGFSPENLKLDGGFHSLKVSIKNPPGLSVQARLGYYAPTHAASAEEDSKEEISQALFSREEIHNIPLQLNTRLLKTSESEARLTVVSKVDVAKLPFRRVADRNVDDLLVVTGLFDRNGNFLEGITKTVQMRLLDDTLHDKLNDGVSIRSDFKVAPGTYLIRVVVRDSEGQTMAAQNGAAEIP